MRRYHMRAERLCLTDEKLRLRSLLTDEASFGELRPPPLAVPTIPPFSFLRASDFNGYRGPMVRTLFVAQYCYRVPDENFFPLSDSRARAHVRA